MKPTVLLAESNLRLRDLYRGSLRKQGYDVLVAESGLECVRQLRRERPRVLVLDMELVWGGGDGVLGWLRDEGAPFAIPVIVTMTAGREAAMRPTPPVVQFLPKPFELNQLLESVRAAFADPDAAPAQRTLAFSENYLG